MRIVDVRSMPISHEDLIAVTDQSVYYRQKTDEVSFSLFRFDEADAAVTKISKRDYKDYGVSKLFVNEKQVYFLNESPDHSGIVQTELIAFNYQTGHETILTTFEKRGNSLLYWIISNRYFFIPDKL